MSMKVYILEQTQWDSRWIVGVYARLEDAERVRSMSKANPADLDITEHEVVESLELGA